MKKFLISLFITSITLANSLEIKDESKLLSISNITYNNEEELSQKLNALTLDMLKNGYITSKIVYKNGKLEVIPGKINKIILNDENKKVKKEILGLNNLEGKILNINDIDNIVTEYERLESNNVKVEIDKGNVYIKNVYKPKFNFNTTLSYNMKNVKYDITTKFSQPLKINDEINFNFTYLPNTIKIGTGYSFPLYNNIFNVSYGYTTQKVTKDVNTREHEVSLGISKKLYKDKIKELNISFDTAILDRKQKLKKVTLTSSKLYIDNSLNLWGYKYVVTQSAPILLYTSSKLGISYVNNRIEAFKTKYIPITIDLDNKVKFKYMDIEMKNYLSFFNKENDSKYMFSSNLNNVPIVLDDAKYATLLDLKLKYPITKGKYEIKPFLELALGVTEKECDFGTAIGVEAITKNISGKIKYSINKDKKQNFAFSISASI